MLIKPEDSIPSYRLKVYVDGERILKPYFVDTDEGYVEYYYTDTDGFFVRFEGDLITGRVYGDVTFKIE